MRCSRQLVLLLAGPSGASAVLSATPLERVSPRSSAQPYTAILVVPTGIGASIGGYAGDALPVARAFGAVADRVVTHPNVMNGAQLYWPDQQLFYTEGFALDEFAAGRWGLRPVTAQRVGLLLDAAIEPDLMIRHLQAADACRATLGINIGGYTVTEEPLGVSVEMSPAGASWGTVKRPDALLRAAEKLHAAGCTAIAIVARFPDDEDEEMLAQYRAGNGVDAVGGAEAIISHLVSQHLRIPCAHAPASGPLEIEPELSPRTCAEELGHTFLPCVLVNLARAPTLICPDDAAHPGDIWRDDVDAIVVPLGACGGAAALSLIGSRALVIAVEENSCALQVTTDKLRMDGALVVRSYMEALGLMAAHKAGVNPACLTSNVESIRNLRI
ncbi:hypothetical protein AB1Y20_004520 [Prymnesium parvum]|uniref:DUF3326 domain-containing protein n=1 Tax=Prymnesium parvum TaxID=97485 RepID=A0AB34IWP6_PRYPA